VIYADGSALRLTVMDVSHPYLTHEHGAVGPESIAWRAWLREHERDLAVSEIGLTELRRAADPLGGAARESVRQLSARLTVVRVPDRALGTATLAQAALRPLDAIQLGIAVAHPDVTTVATYARSMARVARLHGLHVLTPGRPDRWWE